MIDKMLVLLGISCQTVRFKYYYIVVTNHASGFLKPFFNPLTPTPKSQHARSHTSLLPVDDFCLYNSATHLAPATRKFFYLIAPHERGVS